MAATTALPARFFRNCPSAGQTATRHGSNSGRLDSLTPVISAAASPASQTSDTRPERRARKPKWTDIRQNNAPVKSFPMLPAWVAYPYASGRSHIHVHATSPRHADLPEHGKKQSRHQQKTERVDEKQAAVGTQQREATASQSIPRPWWNNSSGR